MDRIQDPTATADNKFREAMGGNAATRVRALWLNGMQEELASFIEEMGITLSSSDLTQLRQALDLRFPRWRDAVTKVADITELRALTGTVDGQVIYLAEDGNGGAGDYVIQASATPESLPEVIVLDDGKRAVLQPAASNVTSAISQAESYANNYADTVSAQAETNANSYTDAQITSFAAGAAGVFADTTAGLAGTVEGDYFNVPSGTAGEIYIVYRHDTGQVATEIGRTPSARAVAKPAWAGKRNGWPDPFFRRAQVGIDFLGRQRWRSNANNGFAPASLVPSTVFDGNALRRTGGGTVVQCGPLLWLDEIGAAPGDQVTIYALLSGAVGRDAYITGGFYTATNAPSASVISDTAFQAVRDDGGTGLILSASAERLRATLTIPAGAAAVSLFPYSSTMTAGETFDIHALWAFKGDATDGPNWPTLGDETYSLMLSEINDEEIEGIQSEVSTLQSEVSTLQGEVSTLQGEVSTLQGSNQIALLKKALTDPLTQHIGIVLIGDSITWGMTVTGQEPIEPRYGTLQDTRNNATSPSWANLLHKYLGQEFYEDATVTASAWAGSDGGVAQFEYSKVLDLFPGQNPFTRVNNYAGETPGVWSTVSNASTTLGYYLNGQLNNASDDMRLTFKMTGTGFDLVFAALGDGAKYELFVDNVSQGIYSTQTGDTGLPVSFENVRSHSLGGFKRDAAVELRLIPGDPTRDLFRIEAIRVTRTVRVTNQGIVGTNANRYASLLIDSAVRADDSFALIQLGTNDRAEPASNGDPESLTSLYINLGRIVDAVVTNGVAPILLCANAATNNSKPTYKFDMSDVRSEISRLARDRGISFIDQFAETRSLIAAGDTSWLADGLHPNDAGHLIMFEKIKRLIDGA